MGNTPLTIKKINFYKYLRTLFSSQNHKKYDDISNYEIYDLILDKLLNLNDTQILYNIYYLVEEGENINTVLLGLINSNKKVNYSIGFLYNFIAMFEYSDKYDKFF